MTEIHKMALIFLSDFIGSQPVLSLQRPSGLIQKKIRQGPRPDSESDHVKYKAAKRTLQSRSLRFLLTEKSQDLDFLCPERPQVLG